MVIDAAERYDLRVFVTGRSMVNNVQMARELGYLDVPDDILMNVREMQEHPDSRTVVISTGAQGEPTRRRLTRMANGDHQHIAITEGDTVILSSNPIPGNEALVDRNIDNLFRAGARVVYNRIAPVHVRGHAAREELKIIHRLVQPRHFAGIHGEHRHLVMHRDLAIDLGINEDDAFVLSDGDVLEISEDGAAIADVVPADYVYVDGIGIGDIDHIVLREPAAAGLGRDVRGRRRRRPPPRRAGGRAAGAVARLRRPRGGGSDHGARLPAGRQPRRRRGGTFRLDRLA